MAEEDQDEHLDVAARFLATLPPPWTLGPRSASQLAPGVAEAFRGGWHADDLARHLTANAGDVRNPAAVLGYRLQDLPRPPQPIRRGPPPVCQEHQLEEPCRGCAADRHVAGGR